MADTVANATRAITDTPLAEITIAGTFTMQDLVVGAIFMLIGLGIATVARLLFRKYYAKRLDEARTKSISKTLYFGILVITFLIFVSTEGIDLSGLFVAGGIFAVVIGFATQSVVSNLISGVFLMMEKPAKIGEAIELPDFMISGILVEIGTFSSKVRKYDGTVIRIPNDKFFTGLIRNVSAIQVRRTDVTLRLAYKEDIEKAIKLVGQAIREKMPFILLEPAPSFRVNEFTPTGVDIGINAWYPKQDWIHAQPLMLKIAKEVLDKEGIMYSEYEKIQTPTENN